MTQDFIVYLLVAAAALYLARMLWTSAKGKGSCCEKRCVKNASAKPKEPDELIQIALAPRNGK